MLESVHVLAQNSRREFLASHPASPEMLDTLTSIHSSTEDPLIR